VKVTLMQKEMLNYRKSDEKEVDKMNFEVFPIAVHWIQPVSFEWYLIVL